MELLSQVRIQRGARGSRGKTRVIGVCKLISLSGFYDGRVMGQRAWRRAGRGRHKGGNDCNETDLICVMGTDPGVTAYSGSIFALLISWTLIVLCSLFMTQVLSLVWSYLCFANVLDLFGSVAFIYGPRRVLRCLCPRTIVVLSLVFHSWALIPLCVYGERFVCVVFAA